MIDLTPLDVRNKRGDFKKGMRGYDPQEVDVFLELVAERLEALVRENIQLRDRTRTLQEQVDAQAGREQAVQDALVTAQELRKDIRDQSQREADHVMREAESEARRIISEAEAEGRARVRALERQLDHTRDSLQDMERRRARFLQEFRGLLRRELDVVEVEEERTPLEDRAIDLDLGVARTPSAGRATGSADPNAAATDEAAAATGDDAAATVDDTAATADTGAPTADDAAATADTGAATADTGAATADTAAGGGSGGEDATAERPEPTPEQPRVSDASETRTAGPSERGVSGTHDAEGGSGSPAAPDAESPGEPGQGAGSPATSEPVSGDRDQALDADVGELTGQGEDGPARRVAPPPEVGDGPSSLELELMAGAAGSGGSAESESDSEPRGPAFPDVPDLETVLAEAGIDEVRPPDAEEISPPPPDAAPEDRLALFEEDEEDGKR